MDLINDATGIITEIEKDRISNLPDDIIHHILSFIDIKYAIQTSKLSRKWKHIWSSMSRLNFNSQTFSGMYGFGIFVYHALNHRNNDAQVSAVDLSFTGTSHQFAIEDIVKYAYLHNVGEMTLKWIPGRVHELPQWLFRSRTLKYLTLNDQGRVNNESRIPDSVWDFPVLETLYLGNVRLGAIYDKNLNLFSKCVSLKDLTLHKCSTYRLHSFTVYAPQLSNLTITDFTIFPKVFNIVAPQLETLTASVITKNGTMSSSFNFLRLFTEGFSSLEKVNLSSSNGKYKKEKLLPPLLDLFHVVRSAKYLTLDLEIVECLSLRMNRLLHEPCPFDNLKCLKINMARLKKNDPMPMVPTQVRNYLLENSPTATFIMDLPQAYIKTMTEENRMLKAKTQIQKQLIANLKTELQMKDQLIANHNSKTQVKAQVIAEQNAHIQMQSGVPIPPLVPSPSSLNVFRKRSREHVPNGVMPKKLARLEAEKKLPQTLAEENKMLEEKIQIRDQLIETLKTKLQEKDQYIANRQTKNVDIEKLKSSNIYMQSSVVAPPLVPKPFSSIVLHTISGQQVRNDTMPKNVANLDAEKEQPDAMVGKDRRLEAKIQMQYQVIADLKRELEMKDQFIANLNANIQMKDQVIANLNANMQMLQYNFHMQSNFHTPPLLPKPSSSNMATSSRHVSSKSIRVVQPSQISR